MRVLRPLLCSAWLLAACDQVTPPEVAYFAKLVDAQGLKVGSAVYVRGVQVGGVKSVQLEAEAARVELQLKPGAELSLRQGACVEVGFYGVGNPAHLKLDLGKSDAPVLAPGAEISCVRQAGATVSSAERLIAQVAAGKGTLGKLVMDEALAKKVERFFEQGAVERPPVAPAESAATEPEEKPEGKPAPAAKQPAVSARPPRVRPTQPPPPPKPTAPDTVLNPF